MNWQQDNISDVFCLTFEVTVETFGHIQQVKLCPNGEEREVNLSNRQEYLELYIDYLVNKSIERIFHAFYRGFKKVCAGDPLKMCRPLELELMICGHESKELSVGELQSCAGYDDGFHADHPLIKYSFLM